MSQMCQTTLQQMECWWFCHEEKSYPYILSQFSHAKIPVQAYNQKDILFESDTATTEQKKFMSASIHFPKQFNVRGNNDHACRYTNENDTDMIMTANDNKSPIEPLQTGEV